MNYMNSFLFSIPCPYIVTIVYFVLPVYMSWFYYAKKEKKRSKVDGSVPRAVRVQRARACNRARVRVPSLQKRTHALASARMDPVQYSCCYHDVCDGDQTIDRGIPDTHCHRPALKCVCEPPFFFPLVFSLSLLIGSGGHMRSRTSDLI